MPHLVRGKGGDKRPLLHWSVDANAFFLDDLERRCRLDGDSGSHSVLGISLGGDPYRSEGSPAPHGRTPGGS